MGCHQSITLWGASLFCVTVSPISKTQTTHSFSYINVAEPRSCNRSATTCTCTDLLLHECSHACLSETAPERVPALEAAMCQAHPLRSSAQERHAPVIAAAVRPGCSSYRCPTPQLASDQQACRLCAVTPRRAHPAPLPFPSPLPMTSHERWKQPHSVHCNLRTVR
jgi:hypothetical protein